MPKTDLFSKAIGTVSCPRCEAAVGDPCIRNDGRFADSCHNERLRASVEKDSTRGSVSQPYMGLAELADYLGWTKQRLNMRRKRHPEEFPEPVAELALGPVWKTEEVILWFAMVPVSV